MKSTTLRLGLLVALIFCVAFGTEAQKKKKKKGKNAVEEAMPAIPKKPKKEEKKGPKNLADFIDTTFVTKKGMITVHQKEDKYYFEIPESLLEREIMAVTRYSKTAAGGRIFGGEEVNRQVIKWELGPNDKMFLRSITYVMMSPDSTTSMAQAVENSNSNPIIASLDIKALKKADSTSGAAYVVDVSSTFNADNQVFSLDPRAKQFLKISSFAKDRSFIQHINSYPINTEIRTVKTFKVSTPRVSLKPTPSIGRYLPASRDAGVVTMEFNTSMLLLPEVPMEKRYFDARVGYFANQYSVFKEESHKAEKDIFAVRWRLEPKNEADAAKQRAGELIEPKKPIVYYIDPATPMKWRPYLKAGVDDWNVAFENAGWKNAIRGEYWPEDDEGMSLEDARFSVIRYFAADIQNAYGPNVHDPRSGEILESHIGWYHNIMKLLRNWYLIQTAAVNGEAQKMKFDDEVMGRLVQFVSSHEVGHTLGLRHNMGASSATPVENLRSKEWTDANGHTSSIMDYARFNYVAQPGDGVTNFFPKIGAYDKWAIKWGYGYMGEMDADAQKAKLNEMTKEAYKDPYKRFGTEISPYDPRYQTEDLGDNAMLASNYGIMNLKRIAPKLLEWSNEEGESYQQLQELYGNVSNQFSRYIGHVSKNIGGVYDSPKTHDMEGAQFEIVPKATQKEAVAWLNKEVFQTPTWLVKQDILSRIKPENGVEMIKAMQTRALGRLLTGDRAVRLMEASSMGSKYYNLDNLMTDLRRSIFSEISGKRKIDIYRRNLQKAMVNEMIGLMKAKKASVRSVPVGVTYGYSTRNVDLTETDLPSIARGHLRTLRGQIRSAIPAVGDKMSNYHLRDLLERIDVALDPR